MDDPVHQRNIEPGIIVGENTAPLESDRLAGYRILVTDDDMRCLFTISGILEGSGAEVLTAVSGHDALDKLANKPDVDLVLMDLQMPGLSGLEAMEKIRARLAHSDLPLICMKGGEKRPECPLCNDCLAHGHLTKPFTQSELLEKIGQLLPESVTSA